MFGKRHAIAKNVAAPFNPPPSAPTKPGSKISRRYYIHFARDGILNYAYATPTSSKEQIRYRFFLFPPLRLPISVFHYVFQKGFGEITKSGTKPFHISSGCQCRPKLSPLRICPFFCFLLRPQTHSKQAESPVTRDRNPSSFTSSLSLLHPPPLPWPPLFFHAFFCLSSTLSLLHSYRR